MVNNKIVYGDTVLLDLTGDTVSAADVTQGVTFHLPSGEQATGTKEDGETVELYADSSAPSSAATNDLWVDYSDAGGATLKVWDYVLEEDTPRDIELISNDAWLQEHYDNDTILLSLFDLNLTKPESLNVINIVVCNKPFLKLSDGVSQVGLRTYVNAGGTGTNSSLYDEDLAPSRMNAIWFADSGTIKMHGYSGSPIKAGRYRIFGWIVEGGFHD